MANQKEITASCAAEEHAPHEHKIRSEAVWSFTADLFNALGDRERLKLMALLLDGPHCVSELAAETGQSMSAISQRLKILYQAKLVQKQRSGKHIYYSLLDEHVVGLLRNAIEHAEETTTDK